MIDERYYCIKCRIPTEYLPELELYSCGRCEQMFDKREVIPGKLIRPSLEEQIQDIIEVPKERRE